MSLTSQTFNKQRRAYFSYLWRGLALIAIGAYCGLMILKNGMGDSVNNGKGINVLISNLMAWMTERGADAEMVVTYSLIGVFAIIVIIGIFNVVRGLWLMLPTHTMLGKSILTQLKGSESFADAVDSINIDMEQEPHTFGGVSIGRKWLCELEAMRLDDIRGVFRFDEGEDHMLCCVDKAQNIWAASIPSSNVRDEAAKHLQKTLPGIVSGDKGVYFAFLRGDTDSNEQAAADPAAATDPPPLLPGNATFCFVGADGIPTSNFTCEEVCGALRALKGTRTIALRVLTPSDCAVSEISFARSNDRWKVEVACRQDDGEMRVAGSMGEGEVVIALQDIMRQKKLPDFCGV